MNNAVDYSFDPLATLGRKTLAKNSGGAAPGHGARAGYSGGSITHRFGANHNKKHSSVVSAIGNGYGKNRVSDNHCFSNIRQITVSKDSCKENGNDKNGILDSDKLIKESEGLIKDRAVEIEEQNKENNASSQYSDSGISLSVGQFGHELTTPGSATKVTPVSSLSSTSAPLPSVSSGTTFSSRLPTLNLNLNLPPVTQTITHGFGVKMVATSSSQQLIYRSVPPRPLSYTLTDVLDPIGPLGGKHRSKTAPVSTNTPEEYAQRFKSRPTTRPRVIDFDGTSVSSKYQRPTMTPGFPTARAKIYIGHPKSRSPTESAEPTTSRSPGSRLQLQPLGATGRYPTTPGQFTSRTQRSDKTSLGTSAHNNYTQYNPSRTLTKSATSSVPGYPTRSTTSTIKASESLRETTQSIDFTTSIPQDLPVDIDDHIHNPDLLLTSSTDCDDLAVLPRPKKVLPKRELPWVFRYKVKRGMNALTKIMASKPPQSMLQPTHAFT